MQGGARKRKGGSEMSWCRDRERERGQTELTIKFNAERDWYDGLEEIMLVKHKLAADAPSESAKSMAAVNIDQRQINKLRAER